MHGKYGRASKLQSMPTAPGGARTGIGGTPAFCSTRSVHGPTNPMRESTRLVALQHLDRAHGTAAGIPVDRELVLEYLIESTLQPLHVFEAVHCPRHPCGGCAILRFEPLPLPLSHSAYGRIESVGRCHAHSPTRRLRIQVASRVHDALHDGSAGLHARLLWFAQKPRSSRTVRDRPPTWMHERRHGGEARP